VPPAARKESQAALKACKKKDLQSCANHLERAILIDPEFLTALNDLGRVYTALDQPQMVISTYEKVLKIDSLSADAYSFIGAAEATLDQFSNAEAAARQALRLDPLHRRAAFVLGVSLALQKKNDTEALQCLTRSYDTYPGARMMAAYVMVQQGRVADARALLASYLPIAPLAKRRQIEDWLAKLDSEP
jgi:tetratricopeptide (TPR) repeat protein